MILEDETFEAFGYHSCDLSFGSEKRVVAACKHCGKRRTPQKNHYHSLCRSCSKKGHIVTEETRAKLNAAQKGEKSHNFGKRDINTQNYKGGKKLSLARERAKRRGLGHYHINDPFEGAEGHHIMHNIIAFIPAYIHHRVWHNLHTSQGMQEINTLALKFLLGRF